MYTIIPPAKDKGPSSPFFLNKYSSIYTMILIHIAIIFNEYLPLTYYNVYLIP